MEVCTDLSLATPCCAESENQVQDKLSTELNLFDPTWTKLKRTAEDDTAFASNPEHETLSATENAMQKFMKRRNEVAAKISRLLIKYSFNEAVQQIWKGPTNSSRYMEPWPIKKTLTMTDVGRNMHRASRLVLRRKLVNKHILPYLSYQIISRVENQGAGIRIYDLNTSSEHQLIFKRWKGSGTYVLMSTWSREFVKRRQLKEGDLIGFCWDAHKLILVFSVIMRAGSQYPPA
ncbi:B3 domain-containing protein [Pyrus ussuriensis x Pyrus communis]|uniref:B3 domain-containing protein n=1 Tax=Pyrus ussuriensis x Pyrus communis TaxID=2448454 RepID=A0A5N5FZP6_9ROSA|nr:B3 domain-containing protein [Pyrus ussuriensis x Pyrus communis]